MKREIKFRAYYQYGDDDWIMLYNVQNSYDNIGNITDEHGKLACDPESSFADFIQGQNDGVELMEYTGLHDKNGREIYEGDILKVTGDDGDSYMAKVKWFGDENYPAFNLSGVPSPWDYEANALSEIMEAGVETCEVIGNIFENPELLEGE